ncbi:hypothetical protein GCM10011521_07350 [Arenimonas soli]|uniref:Serine/threonine protein phosphatase n=1 Tax=Arenimonas soli TaxID=2269504 RepID=A0ABQ1HE61_9GAMM|nr:hypothetical protein [Arenimonas soli]GGA71735.1 hypothetical protein GCM10011521_07350 [Arenimonas soli]
MAATRVQRESWQGQVAWRKTYAEGGRRRRVAALRWVARRLGANALLAPMPLSPELACRTEQAMINRLAALGAHVPPLLAVADRELLLGDLGPTLAVACRAEADAGKRRELVQLGLDALASLHASGGYLSQAFARNMTLRDGRIGFIDLEEDPCTMMSLPAAQARDVLFYAHSTARFLSGQPGEHARLLQAHLAREAPEVRREVARTASRLAWLAPLAKPFGRRSRDVAEALASLARATA